MTLKASIHAGFRGLSGTTTEQEIFLLDVAHLADLNGWELDRLMYGYLNEFLMELRLLKVIN